MAEPRSLPSDAVERLLAAANGDAALLYLHFAAGRPLENAREALRMSEARYDLACATLQQLGLWPQEPQRHLDASQAPVYTEQDVIRETHTSREFEAITGETQRRLGRVLSNDCLLYTSCRRQNACDRTTSSLRGPYSKKKCHPFGWHFFLEQDTGVEPASSAWEADVLPMYESCI